MTKDKNPSAIVRLPDLSNANSIQEFLEQPSGTIAAAVTGVLASGRGDFFLAAGRLVQAALKKQLYQQFGREIESLIDKGKLKENYADEPIGFKSLQEVVEFIDSEAPDEDRLRGVKAMFYAVNSKQTAEDERILMYELLRLAKRLSGSEIRLLAVLYKLVEIKSGSVSNMNSWIQQVSTHLGHGLRSLIELNEAQLVSLKLLEPRREVVVGEITTTARLTDLGIKFCESLKNYDDTVKEIAL